MKWAIKGHSRSYGDLPPVWAILNPTARELNFENPEIEYHQKKPTRKREILRKSWRFFENPGSWVLKFSHRKAGIREILTTFWGLGFEIFEIWRMCHLWDFKDSRYWDNRSIKSRFRDFLIWSKMKESRDFSPYSSLDLVNIFLTGSQKDFQAIIWVFLTLEWS